MAEAGIATRVSATPEALTIEWSQGGVSEFASLWLRDSIFSETGLLRRRLGAAA